MFTVYEEQSGFLEAQYWEKKLLELLKFPESQLISLFRATWFFRFLLRYLTPKSTVVDLGCGVGLVMKALAQENIRCIGVDYAPHLLEGLTDNNVFQTICADIRKLPLKNQSMDVAMSVSSIEHVEVGLQDAIKEAFRILKPGGIFILLAPKPNLLDHFIVKLLSSLGGKKRRKYFTTMTGEKYACFEDQFHTQPQKGFHAYWLTKLEWKHLCEREGFSLQKIERGDMVGGLVQSKIFGEKVGRLQKKMISQYLANSDNQKWQYDIFLSEKSFFLFFPKLFYSYLNGMVFKKPKLKS